MANESYGVKFEPHIRSLSGNGRNKVRFTWTVELETTGGK